MITMDGITQPIVEWALDYGIYPAVISDRLARGWTAERAITAPMMVAPHQRLNGKFLPGLPKCRHPKATLTRPNPLRPKKLYEWHDRGLTITELSRSTGISTQSLRNRMARGLTIAQAVAIGSLPPGRPGWSRTCQPLWGPAGGASRKVFPK